MNHFICATNLSTNSNPSDSKKNMTTSVLSIYCPLYPGIPSNTSSSSTTTIQSSSSCLSISTTTSSHKKINQLIQNHQPLSINSNNNSESFQTDNSSQSKSSHILPPSLNSIEINNPDNIMICLTTSSINEDKIYHPKHRHYKNKKTIIPHKLCHHIKFPVKLQQNKTQHSTQHPYLLTHHFIRTHHPQFNRNEIQTHTLVRT